MTLIILIKKIIISTPTSTEEIECDTIENSLKELNIKNLDYLKIDTQGSELQILKGLGTYRPSIIKLEAHIFSMYASAKLD